MTNPFGFLFSLDQLNDAVEAHLRKWLQTYLSEVAEQRGEDRGIWENPKFWARSPVITPDTIEQVRYPALLMLSPGLTEQPRRSGDGTYDGNYMYGLTILVTSNNETNARNFADRYGAAIRDCIIQPHEDEPMLGHTWVQSVRWIDERTTDYLNANQEAVASSTQIFNIGVRGVLNARRGPVEPDPLPEPATDPNVEYAERPTVGDPNDPDEPYDPVTTNPLGGQS